MSYFCWGKERQRRRGVAATSIHTSAEQPTQIRPVLFSDPRLIAMQGLADALRDCTKWIEGPREECVAETQMDLLDQARAALAAAKPLLEEK